MKKRLWLQDIVNQKGKKCRNKEGVYVFFEQYRNVVAFELAWMFIYGSV